MGQSLTSALTHAWEQTADPRHEWKRATVTDIALVDLQASDLPSRLVLTATLSTGLELVWECSIPDADEEIDALLSHLPIGTASDSSVDVSLADEPIWVRQATADDKSVPVTSARLDRSGEWLLASLDTRQQRHGLIARWGRVLTATVLFLDSILGVWRILLQLALIIVLASTVGTAWAIVLAGLLILACQEVALKAFSEPAGALSIEDKSIR